MSSFEELVEKLRNKMTETENLSEFNVFQVKRLFNLHLHLTQMKDFYVASNRDFYMALAHVVNHQLVNRWLGTQRYNDDNDPKRVYYLSLEYNMGRNLYNFMINLNMENACNDAIDELGLNMEDLESMEDEADLGNGEKGYLAAAILDSMSTVGLPAYSYGLRYDCGLFKQKIVDGNQVEEINNWLYFGNPWERSRPEYAYPVQFYGKVTANTFANFSSQWVDTEVVYAIPYDIPVPGYRNNVVSTLRLWSVHHLDNSTDSSFSDTDAYIKHILERTEVKHISSVLQPNGRSIGHDTLILKQEYVMVSATLQDIMSYFKYASSEYDAFENFPDRVAIEINDSQPSLIIPELMRILIDKENLSWENAWRITTKVCSYTNRTIDSEYLERWPVHIMNNILPRHLQIIREINRSLLLKVSIKWPDDVDRQRRMSIIEEGAIRRINMANLAVVGCHSVNSVSEMHFSILKYLFKDFYEMWPQKFQNVTNGITPRRWLVVCNPPLADLMTKWLKSSKWINNLDYLKVITKFVNNSEFVDAISRIKNANKLKLADYLKIKYNIVINPSSMFDVQVSRIYEHKRHLLKCLHIIVMYNRIKRNPKGPFVSRTIIFGGKAAPSCHLAKQIITFILALSRIINSDFEIGDKLRIVFVENYTSPLAEKIIPATDLNEQLAPAGTEIFGANCLNCMFNGGLTIGTLNGVFDEVKNELGEENVFSFGMNLSAVNELKMNVYNPHVYYNKFIELKEAIDQIKNGHFSPDNKQGFSHLVDHLMHDDSYFTFADYESYIKEQGRVDNVFLNNESWLKKVILNIASAGRFTSDRTVSQYAKKVWSVEPYSTKIPLTFF